MRPVQRRAISCLPSGVWRPVSTPSLYCRGRKYANGQTNSRRTSHPLPSITVSQYHEPGGHRHAPPIPLRQRSLLLETDDLVSSPQQNDPVTWVQKLGPYLPFRLRAVPEHLKLDSTGNAEASFPPLEQLVPFLEKANESVNSNLLSFIGVHQERWETLMWLVREILQICPSYSSSLGESRTLPRTISWKDFHTINEKVDIALIGEPVSRADWSLETFLDRGRHQYGFSETSLGNRAVGQMWLVVGTLILQASDRPKTDPAHGTIMSMVLYILAQMHHLDLLPASIYNYETGKTELAPVRPPTLYLLSHRILAVLSDTAWKHHWEQEMADAIDYGYELSKPRVQPQLPRMGPEVWLDLVLWACVQGSWIREAGQLIMDIESRKEDETRKWTTKSWDEMCKTSEPKQGLATLLKLQINRSRLNQSTGISIANSGTSSIDPGPRTISREVVLAIVDGLSNVLSDHPQNDGKKSLQVFRSLEACNCLLGVTSDDADNEIFASLVLKDMPTSSFDRRTGSISDSTLSDKLGSLDFLKQRSRQRVLQNQDSDKSGPLLGFLYGQIDILARRSNLLGSLGVLEQIIDIVDSNRDSQLNTFVENTNLHRGQPSNASPDLQGLSAAPGEPPSLFPDIPLYAMEALLNLVVDTRQFDLGHWLIFNDDADGGPLTPRLLDEESLQSALLRYATAAGNDQLKMAILDRMSRPPFSEAPMAVHALMGHQIEQGKWDVVEKVLRHTTTQSGLSWSARDVMNVAAVVLQEAERASPQPYSERAPIVHPLHILQSLINGDYQPLDTNAAGRPRLLAERRLANQLYRILCSLGGPFSLLQPGPGDLHGRAHYPTPIAPPDFKILLDAVIQHRGLDTGMAFYDQWVAEPAPAPQPQKPPPHVDSSHLLSGTETEKELVVEPTLSLFRSVINGVQDEYRAALRAAIAAGVRNRETQVTSHTHTPDTNTTANAPQDGEAAAAAAAMDPDEVARRKELFKRAGDRRRWAAQRARALGHDGQAFRREILEGTGIVE